MMSIYQYLTQRPANGTAQTSPALLPPPPGAPRPGAGSDPPRRSPCGRPLSVERHHRALPPPKVAQLPCPPLPDARRHAPRMLSRVGLLHGRGVPKLCQRASDQGTASVPEVAEPLLCAREENVEDQGAVHSDLPGAVRKPVHPLNVHAPDV